jgi:hypothetical protein
MPFKSQAQKKFLFASKPKLAKEFQAQTPKTISLPKKATPKTAQPKKRM